MRRACMSSVVLALVIGLACYAAQAAPPSEYQLTDSGMAGTGSRAIGDFFGTNQYMNPADGGQHVVDIHAINDNGVVVGEFVQGTGTSAVIHGFRGTEDLGRMVGVANGAYLHYVSNINNNGRVVGQYTVTGGPSSWRPFVADAAWGTGLPTFLNDGPNDNARPNDINDAGYIVGQYYLGGNYKACLWNPADYSATPTYITLPAGGREGARAGAINSSMNIAGNCYGEGFAPNYWYTAWVTGANSTAATAIPAPANLDDGSTGVFLVMDDMNENGTVIGSAGRPWTFTAPFVWVPTTANGTTGTSTMMDSVTDGVTSWDVDPDGSEVKMGRSCAINDAGLAVGWLNDGDTAGSNCMVNGDASFGWIKDVWMKDSTQAFLWDTASGTEGVLLESLLPQAEQDLYHLLIATDINNSDQVTVLYKLDADITANGFADAPIYAGILNASSNPLIPGDCDGDGDVDLTDLAILASNYGAVEPPVLDHSDGDFDDDGDVDLTDLAILANNWGFGTMTAVPEPASMGLIALGGLAIIRRRC